MSFCTFWNFSPQSFVWLITVCKLRGTRIITLWELKGCVNFHRELVLVLVDTVSTGFLHSLYTVSTGKKLI